MKATTIDDDCSICGHLIEIGEDITKLSAGAAHVKCFSEMLPPERYSSPSQKAAPYRRNPGSYRPGVVS